MKKIASAVLLSLPLAAGANAPQHECVIPGAGDPAADPQRGNVASVVTPLVRPMPMFARQASKPAERPDFTMVFCSDAVSSNSAGSTADLERMTRRCVF